MISLRDALGVVVLGALCGCHEMQPPSPSQPVDPDVTEVVAIDRFADGVAARLRRSLDPTLPGPNEPIDFDRGPPFFTWARGPHGERVGYYTLEPAQADAIPLYVLFHESEMTPIAGQLNIVPFVPGDPEYNDIWRVIRVIVPASYVTNSATSLSDLTGRGYRFERTTILVNCPIVPNGSSATRRFRADDPPILIRGWYRHKVVTYFTFAEQSFSADASDRMVVGELFATYDDLGAPFVTKVEPSGSSHNVVATLPNEPGYSPLRRVRVYDNRDFDAVTDLATAATARAIGTEETLINAPIVVRE